MDQPAREIRRVCLLLDERVPALSALRARTLSRRARTEPQLLLAETILPDLPGVLGCPDGRGDPRLCVHHRYQLVLHRVRAAAELSLRVRAVRARRRMDARHR